MLVDSNNLTLSSTLDCIPVLSSERQGRFQFVFTCHLYVSLDWVILMSCVHYALVFDPSSVFRIDYRMHLIL